MIETHPENVADLRLSCPFQQLADYVDKFDLDGLDQTDHGHVPFVVVLLKYAKAYQDAHDGKAPQTYQERQELIKMLRENMRTPDEENFEEAIANVWRLASSSNVKPYKQANCMSNTHKFFFLYSGFIRSTTDI